MCKNIKNKLRVMSVLFDGLIVISTYSTVCTNIHLKKNWKYNRNKLIAIFKNKLWTQINSHDQHYWTV